MSELIKLYDLEKSIEDLEKRKEIKQTEYYSANAVANRKKSELNNIQSELKILEKQVIRRISQLNLDQYKPGDNIKIDDPDYNSFYLKELGRSKLIFNRKNSFYSKGLGRNITSDIEIIRVNKVSLTVKWSESNWHGNSHEITERISLEKIKRIESNIYQHEQNFNEDKQIVMRDEELNELLR